MIPVLLASALFEVLNARGPVEAGAIMVGLTAIAVHTRSRAIHSLAGGCPEAGGSEGWRGRSREETLAMAAGLVVPASFALFILSYIVVLPLGAWVVWLEQAAEGEPRGAVSYAFGLMGGFGFAIAGGNGYRRPITALLAAAALAAFLVMVGTGAGADRIGTGIRSGFAPIVAVGPVVGTAVLLVVFFVGAAVAVRLARIGGRGYRTRAAAVGLIFVLLSATAGQLMSVFNQPTGSRLVSRLSPVFEAAIERVFPALPMVYGVPGYGHGFERGRLGEGARLSGIPVFELRSAGSRTYYLRTQVFDRYDGEGWSAERLPTGADLRRTVGQDSAEPPTGPGPASGPGPAGDPADVSRPDEDSMGDGGVDDQELDYLSEEEGRSEVELRYRSGRYFVGSEISDTMVGPEIESEPEIELRLLTDFYPFVPHLLDTIAFELIAADSDERESAEEPQSGDTTRTNAESGEAADVPALFHYARRDLGYRPEAPLVEGDLVRLWSVGQLEAGLSPAERDGAAASQAPDDNGLPSEPQLLADATAEPVELPAEEHRRYTRLPDEVSDRVRELAEDLTTDDPERTIRGILRELQKERFTYSLSPSPRPAERELAEHFLFHDSTGYCVHFATTFVVLAREAGIPARYVTGFYAPLGRFGEDTRRSGVEITGYASHAWVEVYLEEGGWTVVEPTPPMRGDGEDRPPVRIAEDERTRRQLGRLFGPRRRDRGLPRIPLWLPLGSVATVAFGFGSWALWRGVRPFLGSLPRRFARELERVTRVGRRVGIPGPEQVGWTDWGRRAGAAGLGPPGARLAKLAGARFFGRRAVGYRDLRFVRLCRRRIDRVRYSNGIMGWRR